MLKEKHRPSSVSWVLLCPLGVLPPHTLVQEASWPDAPATPTGFSRCWGAAALLRAHPIWESPDTLRGKLHSAARTHDLIPSATTQSSQQECRPTGKSRAPPLGSAPSGQSGAALASLQTQQQPAYRTPFPELHLFQEPGILKLSHLGQHPPPPDPDMESLRPKYQQVDGSEFHSAKCRINRLEIKTQLDLLRLEIIERRKKKKKI